MTTKEIKLELKNANKQLEEIEKEIQRKDISSMYAMDLEEEIKKMHDYIESLEDDLDYEMTLI